MTIGERERRQFEEEGYFFRQQLLTQAQVGALGAACDALIEEFNGSEVVSSEGAAHFVDDQIVTRKAADGSTFQANTISHKYDRYFLQNLHERQAAVRDVIMSREMAEVCAATLGASAYYRGRDAGCPAPPAQIRTGPLGHPAPPLGSAPHSADGKSLVRPRVSDFQLGPMGLGQCRDIGPCRAVLLRP